MSSEETRTALLDAARQLVGERGYAGATTRELAAVAGTNIGAVNYHFGSREKLLNEAILELFLEWADRTDRMGRLQVDPNAEPLAQFAARARPLVEGIAPMQPAFVVALEALLQARRSPELHRQLVEHYAEHRRRLVASMAGTERGSQLPPRYLEVVASYMLAIGDGLQLQALLDPDAIPTGDELAAIYENLAAAARAAGPPTA